MLPIPKGKKVIIHQGGTDIFARGKGRTTTLVLDEDITLNLQSNFMPFFGQFSAIDRILDKAGKIAQLGQAVGQAIGIDIGKEATLKFAQSTLPTWQNTEPLTFTCTLSFYYDSGASGESISSRKNVFDPMKTLAKLPLPEDREGGNKILGLKSPIPNTADLIKAAFDYTKNQKGFLSMTIGNIIYLPNIIILKAEPIFSSDSTTTGYPVWGKMQLTVRSLISATKEQIENGMNSVHGR